MRTLPLDRDTIPEGTQVVILGDPAHDCHAVEYLIAPSQVFDGRHSFTCVIELEEEERELLAAGHRLALTFEGAEVPWGLHVIPAE